MIKIPAQLQNPNFRFCLIRQQRKAPFEKDWQNRGYKFDDEKLLKHLEEGGNYGVIGGYGNLRILDIDREDLIPFFADTFKDTFIVKTGSGKIHIYILSDYNINRVLSNGAGEFRANNYQAVGVGSIHPNGQKYVPYNQNQIKEFSEKQISETLKSYLREEQPTQLTTENKTKDNSRSGLEYRKVIALFRKGKTRAEIIKEMQAYAKWVSAPEQYRQHQLDSAENFVLQEQDKKAIKDIQPTEEIEKNIELSKEIFNEIEKIISKYIDTTQQNIVILTLWVLGTYFHENFETFPLLQIIAQKRSGKSRLLKLLSSLSYGSDGSVSTSPTETHLFRHKEGALFFDEMENISSKERGAFRETLNAVYKKGNKIIRYQEKKINGAKEYVEDAFYPYYPLGLANISGFGDVLSDRAIQIILRRSNKKLTKLVEDFQTNKEILSLKDKLSHLRAKIPKDFFSEWNDYINGIEIKSEKLKEIFKKINETKIYGRSLEIFFPLFIISYLCENLDDFLKIAKDYVITKEEEEAVDDIDERLKEFISKRQETGFINQSILLRDFRGCFEAPEEWINSKWFGRALKRLDLIKQKRQVNGKVQIIINPTNTINTINTTNAINTTNQDEQVVLVELVAKKGLVANNNPLNSIDFSKSDIKEGVENG